MRTQKRSVVLLTLFVMSASALAAQGLHRARGGHHGRGFGGPGMMGEMFAGMLDLTEEQRQQVREIHQAARAEARPIRRELKAGREAMQKAIRTNNTAEIERLAAGQGELRGQLTAIFAKSRAEFRALLTPEQAEKLDSFRERMKERRKARRERGFGSRPEPGPESEQ